MSKNDMPLHSNYKDQPARALVVGGGGIGTITALNLFAGGLCEVSLVLRSNYSVVSQTGYQINSIDHGLLKNWRPHQVLQQVPTVLNNDPAPFHYIICTMKNIMDSLISTLDIIRPAITPSFTTVVLIQNGLNIERPFLLQFPANCVLSGVSYAGSHEHSHGIIEQEHPDKLELGIYPNSTYGHERGRVIAEDFLSRYTASGKTNAAIVKDVAQSRWTKLLFNAAINPLSAILKMDCGSLHMSGALDIISLPAMEELHATAAAKGCLIATTAIESTMEMAKASGSFQPSMLVDISKGNLIEFEAIIGEPMREAMALGIPTPHLNALYKMCQALQWRCRQEKP